MVNLKLTIVDCLYKLWVDLGTTRDDGKVGMGGEVREVTKGKGE